MDRRKGEMKEDSGARGGEHEERREERGAGKEECMTRE